MVDPYATKIGGLTAVINSERFVLEHPDSNTILSLHPAFTLEGRTQPTAFINVSAFRATENRLEVEWVPVEGVGALTLLELDASGDGGQWFSLAVTFNNHGDTPLRLAEGHPLYIPVEGPGALALGHRELLTLAQGGEASGWYMIPLDGDDLSSERMAVFFAPGGSPAAVMASEDSEGRAVRFVFHGARGKLLSLAVSGAVGGRLEPKGILSAPPLSIGLGLADPVGAIERLMEDMQWPESDGFPPVFDPSGEPETLPIITEEEQAVEEALELESDEQALADDETDAPQEADEAPLADDDAMDDEGEVEFITFPAGLSGSMTRRTAFFLQAQRNTRSFEESGQVAYHGWAGGRRREPVCPSSLRTRRLWRCSMPRDDEKQNDGE